MTIDWDKIITFRHEITLDNGIEGLNTKMFELTDEIICRGKSYKLNLINFEINSEHIFFEWEGRKDDVVLFYTYYSVNIVHECAVKRYATQGIIMDK